jgi:hypothetical protein
MSATLELDIPVISASALLSHVHLFPFASLKPPPLTFSHQLSADLSVFKMDENASSTDEVADSAGTEGGVPQSGPAFSEQREAAFATTAQAP